MEDFILREIDKIGVLLRGMLHKIGILRRSDAPETVGPTAKTELADRLDIEALLAEEDFVSVLVERHGFGPDDLELFPELLADLAAAAETSDEARRCAAAACPVYRHQGAHKAPASLGRYYILKELAKYNP